MPSNHHSILQTAIANTTFFKPACPIAGVCTRWQRNPQYSRAVSLYHEHSNYLLPTSLERKGKGPILQCHYHKNRQDQAQVSFHLPRKQRNCTHQPLGWLLPSHITSCSSLKDGRGTTGRHPFEERIILNEENNFVFNKESFKAAIKLAL